MDRIDDLRSAAAERPDDPLAWCRLALALAESGDSLRARDALRRAQSVAPDDADVWLEIGRTSEQAGDLQGAVMSYRRATNLDRRSSEAYRALGTALIARGDPAAAGLALRVALSLGEDADLHGLLATALSSVGKHEEAIEHARRALELAPNDPVLSRHLARTLERAGRTAESVLALRKLVDIDPQDIEAAVDLAAKLAASGDTGLAKVEVAKVLAAGVRTPELDTKLGAVLLACGEVGHALDLLRDATRQKPGMPEGHYHLGLAEEAAGLFDEALASFRSAARLAPTWVSALYRLGLGLRRAGELREASNTLVRAAALAPDDGAIQEALGGVMAARNVGRTPVDPAGRASSESISGDLAILGLPDMLELLAHQRATGALVLTSESRTGQVDLIEGWIMRVHGPARQPLVEVLEENDFVSKTAIKRALEGTVDPGDDERVAERLLERHVIDRAQLAEAIQAQARRALAELISWNTGVLRFYAESAAPYPSDLVMDARKLLAEARAVTSRPAPIS